MSEMNSIRIDKFLWSVRIYKTRSMASEACRKGRIIINDIPVKPSRPVHEEELIKVKKPPVIFIYRVLKTIENRIPAKSVTGYIEDLTPDEEKIKLQIKTSGSTLHREKGTGRPTKKERRHLEKFIGDFDLPDMH
jgi:ribosome-associated heat shock protein Hsp15